VADIAKQIIQEITKEFEKRRSWKEDHSSKFWTKKIGKALRSVADTNDFELRCSKTNSNGKGSNWEFLFDFVLLDTGKTKVGNGYFKDTHMISKSVSIIESEFSRKTDEILYDFCKLLLGKAELKVMIFCQGSNQSTETISKIKQMIQKFSQSVESENYLIIWYNYDKENFSFPLMNGAGCELSNC